MKPLIVAWMLAHGGYPSDCCANVHCHPVPCEEVAVRDHGRSYLWHEMTFSDVRPSPDGFCHVCHIGMTPMCVMPGGLS